MSLYCTHDCECDLLYRGIDVLEGCIYCRDNGSRLIVDIDGDVHMAVCRGDEASAGFLHVWLRSGADYIFSVNYCPICGRDLRYRDV